MNTIIVVVIHACTIATGECRDHFPGWQVPSVKQCTLAMPQIAQWMGEHPHLELKGWSCRPMGGQDA